MGEQRGLTIWMRWDKHGGVRLWIDLNEYIVGFCSGCEI